MREPPDLVVLVARERVEDGAALVREDHARRVTIAEKLRKVAGVLEEETPEPRGVFEVRGDRRGGLGGLRGPLREAREEPGDDKVAQAAVVRPAPRKGLGPNSLPGTSKFGGTQEVRQGSRLDPQAGEVG